MATAWIVAPPPSLRHLLRYFQQPLQSFRLRRPAHQSGVRHRQSQLSAPREQLPTIEFNSAKADTHELGLQTRTML